MNNLQFARTLINIAVNLKTVYIVGAFGWALNDAMKQRAVNAYPYNKSNKHTFENLSADYFGFDCICLIKAVLWGFCGDSSKSYGGAVYQSNGVPDIDETEFFEKCKNISTDFKNIEIGELVWIPGHIGVYVGDGLVVECTHRWKNGVQLTALHNIATKDGYYGRMWSRHGKCTYIQYVSEIQPYNKYELVLPVIKKGDKGTLISSVQAMLIERGYTCGAWGADGDFGGATEKAVKAFQTDCGLSSTGVVDKDTINILLGGVSNV